MTKQKVLLAALIGVVFVSIFSMSAQPIDFNGALSSQFNAQVYSAVEPYYVFSHDGETMIAGKDSWVFKLENAKHGDKLTVKAWKDDVPVNSGRELEICKVRRGGSCSRIGRPTKGDIGKWIEKVFINGIEKGEITIEVKTQRQVSPTIPGIHVISPVSEESLLVGQKKIIKWDVSNMPHNALVSIYLLNPSGSINKIIVSDHRATFAYYNWVVPSVDSGQYYISVACSGANSASANNCAGNSGLFNIISSISSSQSIYFTFSHNNQTMVAGRDRWTITVSGLRAGDVVYADAWKNGTPLSSGSLRICSVPNIVSPFHTSCTASGGPKNRDVGIWEESLFVKRKVGNTTEDIVIGGRGIIRFEVVDTKTTGTSRATETTSLPTTIYYGCVNHQCTVLPQSDSRVHWFGPIGLSSCRVTCETGESFPPPTYSFAGPVNGHTILVGNSYTYTLFGAQPNDILYVRAWKSGVFQGKFTICRVESNNYQCTKSAPVTRYDLGDWEGEVGYTRNGTDSVLGQRGAVSFEVVQPVQ